MKISEHANYLLNEYGRLQFDYAAYCKPYGESLRNEARNNLEEYIAELEAEVTKCHELQDSYCDRIAELEQDLSNKETEYTDLWDDALALQARIAELEGLVDELIEAGDAMSNAQSMWVSEEDKWDALVKDWKEREE